MSSVPYVPPDTIKKVAATRGQSVRRTNFFRLGTTARGWEVSSCCRLAVANFYGCLLKRLTLTTASPLSLLRLRRRLSARLPGLLRFPGHFGEVSSHL